MMRVNLWCCVLVALLTAAAAVQQAVTHLPEPWRATNASVAAASARVMAAAAAAAEALSPAAMADSARCQLTIQGGGLEGGISSAHMECSGRVPVVIAIDEQLLGQHRTGFKGVTWDDSCASRWGSERCLLAICKGNVLLQSRIQGVQGKDFSLNLLCLVGQSKVVLQSAVISDSHGAGVYVFQHASARIDRSRITGIVGRGGLGVEGNAAVVLSGGTVVAENVGRNTSGGGVGVGDNAHASIIGGSQVLSNVCDTLSGAGVAVWGHGSLLLSEGARLINNVVVDASGGGLAAFGNASVVVTGRALISNNTSIRKGGGGIAVGRNASVLVTGATVVSQNTARNAAGGGLICYGYCQMVVSGASHVIHNNGDKGGGGLGIYEFGSVVVDQRSRVSFNRAENGSGGGVSVRESASLLVTGKAVIANNTTPKYCSGGVAIAGNSSVCIMAASVVSGNRGRCGGGLGAFGNSSVTLEGVRVISNVALEQPGGGLLADGNTRVVVSHTVFEFNTVNGAAGGGLSCIWNATLFVSDGMVVGNTATNGSAGGVAALGNASVHISNVTVSNNSATLRAGGGLIVADSAQMVVSGGLLANNSAESGGAGVATNAAMLHITGGCRIEGNDPLGFDSGAVVGKEGSSVLLTNGVVFRGNIPGFLGFGKNVYISEQAQLHLDGTVVDADEGMVVTPCSASVFRGLDVCAAGDYKEKAVSCRCCPQHTYSFTANTTVETCEQCPAAAVCPGGDVVQALPGYWHSGPQSVQMHQCPMGTTACAGLDVGCQPGYQGNLCGSCALPAYGTTLPLKCGKCMPPPKQLGLYVAIALVSALFVAVTVHLTWLDNVQGGTQLQPSSCIRVLVQYTQYLVILGSISAPWPADLRNLFAAASSVFGVASGQALSLDCWLAHYVPTSSLPIGIKRNLVVYLAPALLLTTGMVLFFLVWALRRMWWRIVTRMVSRRSRRPPQPLLLWRQLPVLAIVVLFYAYPTMTQTSLGFFACLRIDDAGQGPHAELALANHTQGYWVGSINQPCFTGWHKGWAFGLGLPAVLLLCFGVPIALGWFLSVNRGRCADPAYRERFGFLYRDYTDSSVWWEATWAGQTVLLTCIAAFHFTLQAYYSVLILTLVFLGSAILQAAVQPYAHVQLHRARLASMTCLFTTSFWTLAVFTLEDFAPVPSAQTAIAVMLLAMNCFFVVWCIYVIASCASNAPIVQRVALVGKKVWVHASQRLTCCQQLPLPTSVKHRGGRLTQP